MLLKRSQIRTQNISVISAQKWKGFGATGCGCSVVEYRSPPAEFGRNPKSVTSSLHPQPLMHLHYLFICFLLPEATTTQGLTGTNTCCFMYSALDFFFFLLYSPGFSGFPFRFHFCFALVSLRDSLYLFTCIILHPHPNAPIQCIIVSTIIFVFTQFLDSITL